MFKFIKRIIGLAIIVVIVIAVIGFIRGRGIDTDGIKDGLIGTTYSWTEEENNMISGYSCNVTYTMEFLEDGTVRMIGDGERVWKSYSSAYPGGRIETVDFDYVTHYSIEGSSKRPVFEYTNSEGSINELDMEINGSKVVKIGKYSKD